MKNLTMYLAIALMSLGTFTASSCACDKGGNFATDSAEGASVTETATAGLASASDQLIDENDLAKKNEAGGYGKVIETEGAISVPDLMKAMEGKESMDARVKGEISACCLKKGCWMDMVYNDGETMKVTFRDYGFFVPFDLPGQMVVVEGTAESKEVSVDDLRHLAEDGGASEEEIAAITEPEWQIVFVADGVMPL